MLRLTVVLVLTCFVFGSMACSRRPNSAIVAKYEASGGGDASSAEVPSIARWLLSHRDLTVELYNMCRPSLNNPPDGNWLSSDEGKICTAALNTLPTKFQSDGVKF